MKIYIHKHHRDSLYDKNFILYYDIDGWFIANLNYYTKSEIYLMCQILIDYRLPFTLHIGDMYYKYRFGHDSQVDLNNYSIDNIILSDEESINSKYFTLMDKL